MEKDDEVKGSGNHVDFGARGYDPRLGKWLSIDPFAAKYPSIAPYAFTANNPVYYVDPDGQKIYIYYESGEIDSRGNPIMVAYTYGSNLKLPRDRFVRKTVRTLNKIQRRGLDPEGAIRSMADDQINHVAIQESQSEWNTSSAIIQFGQATAINAITLKSIDIEEGSLPPDLILWRHRTGLISPDGNERQSASSGLFHEIGHAFYNKIDPYGKIAEFNALLAAGDEEGIARFDAQMAKEVGDYDNYEDKWIIENMESNWSNSWKRESHNKGYFLKTIGGSFSKMGWKYGKNGKTGKVSDLKDGKPLN